MLLFCLILLAILTLCNNYTSARYREIILIVVSYNNIIIVT